MKKLIYLLPIIMILGCAPNETIVVETPEQTTEISVEEIKEQLKEEIKEEVKEELKAEEKAKEEEVTIDNYDYKTDPDTLVVNINEENIDEYFDLKVVYSTLHDTYSVCTHSLMYDKGYVMVGYENCYLTVQILGYEFENNITSLDPTNIMGCQSPFDIPVAHGFTTEEKAKDFVVDIKECNPQFEKSNATIYYQKIEDVKFGYEYDGEKRILNGEELYMFPDNLY